MKTLKTLIALTFIFLITISCGGDDDDNLTEQNSADIIGTWKFTSSTTNGVADTDIYVCELMDLLIITNTTVSSKYFEDPSGMNGNNCEEFDGGSQSYSISGNTISVVDGNYTYTAEIITLNNTTLTTKDVDGNDTYTETYTRQ